MIKRLLMLNGLAILMVVLSHAAGMGQVALLEWWHRYLPLTSIASERMSSFSYYILLIIRQLASFAVPAFVLVSGYFIAFATNGKSLPIRWKITKVRLLGILLPYTFWSIVIFLSDFLIDNIHYNIANYIIKYFTIGADGPYYFIPLICYLYILSIVLIPLIAKYKFTIVIIIGIIQFLLLLCTRYTLLFNITTPFFIFLSNLFPEWTVPRWLFYFAIGIYISQNVDLVKKIIIEKRKMILVFTFIFASAAVIEPEALFRVTNIEVRFGANTISTATYSLLVIFFFLAWLPNKPSINQTLTMMSEKSLGLFLIHLRLMRYAGRFIYHYSPFLLSTQLLFQPIMILFGLILPLGIMEGIKRAKTGKVYSIIFG